MPKKEQPQSPGFEQSISRLEEIIQLTDTPSTELEEVISLVEEGTKLIRHCKNILKQAELRIETLEQTEDISLDSADGSKQHNEDDGTASFSLN